MLLKCCYLLVFLYGQLIAVTSRHEQLMEIPHRMYMRQEENCGGIIYWPTRPFIITRDKREGEIFPREQTVRHFVEDLEIIVMNALGHIRRRQKRDITLREENVQPSLDELCDNGKSSVDPWSQSVNETAFRMISKFLFGGCDKDVETRTGQAGVKKRKTLKSKIIPVPVIKPTEVVEEIKKPPFNNPKSKEWDVVEPSKKPKLSDEKSPYGVVMMEPDADAPFVDPYTRQDGTIVASIAGGKILESFAPQGFSHMLTSHDLSACISELDGFWLRDLMEYMGGECWILGRFARTLYPCVYCKPGVCYGHNRLFGAKPTCFPARFSTHTAWLYCPHLNPGERFRKFSFNLAQSCGCRMC